MKVEYIGVNWDVEDRRDGPKGSPAFTLKQEDISLDIYRDQEAFNLILERLPKEKTA